MQDSITNMQITMNHLVEENTTIKNELALCVKVTSNVLTDVEAAAIRRSESIVDADGGMKTSEHIATCTSIPSYAQKLVVNLPDDSNQKTMKENKTNGSKPKKTTTKATSKTDNKVTVQTNPPNDGIAQQVDNDGFTMYKSRRKKNKRIIVGTKVTDKIRGAPEPSRSVFVRVHSSTTFEDLKEYIESLGLEVRSLDKISHEDAKSKSYRLDIPKRQYNYAFDASIWPKEVTIKPFYRAKSSQKA